MSKGKAVFLKKGKKSLGKTMKNILSDRSQKKAETDILTGKVTEESKRRAKSNLANKPLRDRLFDELNTSGLDYKGQHSMGLVSIRKGASVSISVNVGDIFLPGVVDLSAGMNAQYLGGKALLVNLEVQTDQQSYNSPKLYRCLSLMQGVKREWSIGIEAEVGVGAELEIPNSLEAIGFSAEASIKSGVSASYNGTYIHLCDPSMPKWFSKDKGLDLLKQYLMAYVFNPMDDVSMKKFIQQNAKRFLEKARKRVHYKKVGSAKRIWRKLRGRKGQTIYDELLSLKEELLEQENPDEKLLRDVEMYIEYLKWWDNIKFPFNKYASLRLWGHQGQAEASAPKISLNISAGPASAGVEAGGPTIEGSIKRTSFRYQMIHINGIVKTQDTIITYKQVGGNLYSISGNFSIGIGEDEIEQDISDNVSLSTENPLKKEVKVEKSEEWVWVNQMSYRAAVLFWNPEEVKNGKIKVLPGSGVSYGQSITIDSLCNLYMTIFEYGMGFDARIPLDKLSDKAKKYVKSFMVSLGLNPKDKNDYESLQRFIDYLFNGTNVILDLRNTLGPKTGVLVEANYRSYSTKGLVVSVKSVKDQFVEPEDLLKALKPRKLQAFRIRYRIREKEDDTRNLFKLGIFIGKKRGAGITLKEATEVGTEGIVDLVTFHAEGRFKRIKKKVQSMYAEEIERKIKKENISGKEKEELQRKISDKLEVRTSEVLYNRPSTVPPVVLFCQ